MTWNLLSLSLLNLKAIPLLSVAVFTMETSRIGVPHGEMSKEAQTAMWHQQYHHHDSGIMSGATTTTHSIKGDEDDDYMKTTQMNFEWEQGFSDQDMHAMNEQFVSTRRYVTSCTLCLLECCMHTLCSKINSTTLKYCSIAFTWMVTW